MSIDRLIQDRADTTQITGQRPKSTVSNDLLNLMATQQVAREHEEKLRALQLAQNPDERTIKEQQEAKAAGLTQQELAANTGNALNTRRQQQGKQPMPQAGGIANAQPAPRPPMAAKPPMAGMPTAAPAGMMPKMASGGIIGYNAGSTVNPRAAAATQMQAKRTAAKNTPDAIKAEIQRLQNLAKNSRSGAAKMSAQKQIQTLQQQLNTMTPAMPGLGGAPLPSSAPPTPPPAGGISAVAGLKPTSFQQSAQAATAPTPKPPMAAGTGPLAPPPMGGAPVDTSTPNPLNPGAVAAPPKEIADPNKIREAGEMGSDSTISDKLTDSGVMSALTGNLNRSNDPLQAGKDRFTESSDRLGIAELKGMQTGAQADIAAAQERYDSPEARAQRDVTNYRLAGYKGMLQGQNERQNLELKRLRQKKADMDSNADAIYKRAKAADDNAGKMTKDMMDHSMAVTTAMTNIAVYDETAMRELAKVKSSIEKDAQNSILTELGIKTKADLELTLQKMASSERVLAEYTKFKSAKAAYKAKVFEAFMPDYSTLKAKMIKGKATENEIKAYSQLEDSINAVLGAETDEFQKIYDKVMASVSGYKSGGFSAFNLPSGGTSSQNTGGGISTANLSAIAAPFKDYVTQSK